MEKFRTTGINCESLFATSLHSALCDTVLHSAVGFPIDGFLGIRSLEMHRAVSDCQRKPRNGVLQSTTWMVLLPAPTRPLRLLLGESVAALVEAKEVSACSFFAVGGRSARLITDKSSSYRSPKRFFFSSLPFGILSSVTFHSTKARH